MTTNIRAPLPKKILLLHAGALGDCVLTLHLVASLKNAFPESHVQLCARSAIAKFAVDSGLIDSATTPDSIGLHHLYSSDKLPAGLAQLLADADLIIDFGGDQTGKSSTKLLQHAGGSLISVDPRPDLTVEVPIVQQWLDRMSAAGLDLTLVQGHLIQPSPGQRDKAQDKMATLAGKSNGSIVVCHPGSGGRAKCCPLEIFERVVGCLKSSGQTPVWMIGPTELDWHGQALMDRLALSAPVLFEESLVEAATLLFGADAYIGNDAGMTHVAAGLGLATLALFGPTNPRVWAPLGPAVKVIRFNSIKGVSQDDGRSLAKTVAENLMHMLRAASTPPSGPYSRSQMVAPPS